MPPASPPFLEVLGVRVQALTIAELNALVTGAIEQDRRIIIANHNLHSAYLSRRDPAMRELYRRADHVHIDGMPLVALARLKGHEVTRAHRVTYVDWLGPLMAEAERCGHRVFYLGSSPGVAERGAAVLRERHPGLRLTARDGYFDARPGSAENEAVLEAIHRAGTQLLLVGMGMPRQERWILENVDRLRVNVVLPCGAAIDYVAGAVPTPPRWMGRAGLEWLYRLGSEPGRLWRRYLFEPLFLMGPLWRDLRQAVLRRAAAGRERQGGSDR